MLRRQFSKESGWLPGELEANLALGIVYEELGDIATAVACHERRLELAVENGATVRAPMPEVFVVDYLQILCLQLHLY